MTKVSRRKIADYCAEQLLAGSTDITIRLAALLIDQKRTKELPLIVRDIEDALAARGVVVAAVTTAHGLDPKVAASIEAFIKAKTAASSVHLSLREDAKAIGGIKLELPGHQLDATIRRKLNLLKASKV